MTATPTYHVFTAGEVATAANINAFGTVLSFLKLPPIVEMNQTVAQSYSSSSTPATGATFTTEVVDSSGMHSTSSNTSRCVAVYPGWYEHGGGCGFVANATGSRGGEYAVNGSAVNGSFVWLPANGSGFTATPFRRKLIFLNATDYSEAWLAQTSGGNLNTSVTSIEQTSFSLKWISD